MTWEQASGLAKTESDIYMKARTLIGFPIRVSTKADSQEILRMSGLLERVVVTGFIVDLETPPPTLPTGTRVVLEIISNTALVQTETSLTEVHGRRLYLNLPERLDFVQRRRHPRADVQLVSQLETLDGSKVPVQIVNLSAGGAAFSSLTNHSPGDTILLHLTALGLTPAEIPANVVRSTPIGNDVFIVGVSFQFLNSAQQAKVSQYVVTVLSDS